MDGPEFPGNFRISDFIVVKVNDLDSDAVFHFTFA
jgi:hypothetical protein